MNLRGLNEQQHQAVTAADGPLVIVAGPGTGKTKTLTARIAYLIQERHVPPEQILALTFTNKAAKEMVERVQAGIGKQPARPMIATFHSLAYRVLAGGREPMKLVTDAERTSLLRQIKKELHSTGSVRDLSLALSRAKNQPEPPTDPKLTVLLTAYNAALKASGQHDFDDILLRFHTLLSQPKPTWEPPYTHILVDEFQDTNRLQYALLSLLDITGSLWVIGDPLQSFYGFRGADAAIFQTFKSDHPAARTIRLNTNYRSVPEVVAASGQLFPDEPPLEANRQETGTAHLVQTLNEYGEADWIIQAIETRIGGSDMLRSSEHHGSDGGRTFRDFAVLYRTHAVARAVQQALERSGIPYQVAGEGSPFLRPEIQTILEALAYTAGETSDPQASGYTPAQMRVLLDPLKSAGLPLPELAEAICERLALVTDKNAAAIRQFLNSLVHHAGLSTAAYLAYVRSIAEQEYYDPAADAVSLLTIHASKGLEFPCVFIIAAEDRILPYATPAHGTQNLAEERRLLYVATTRARDELHILHTVTRAGKPSELSSFLRDVTVLPHDTDPAMQAQIKRRDKSRQKRSQTSLF